MDISDVCGGGVRGSKSELHQVQELHLSREERYRILTKLVRLTSRMSLFIILP